MRKRFVVALAILLSLTLSEPTFGDSIAIIGAPGADGADGADGNPGQDGDAAEDGGEASVTVATPGESDNSATARGGAALVTISA